MLVNNVFLEFSSIIFWTTDYAGQSKSRAKLAQRYGRYEPEMLFLWPGSWANVSRSLSKSYAVFTTNPCMSLDQRFSYLHTASALISLVFPGSW